MVTKPERDSNSSPSSGALVPVSRRRNCPSSREINEAIVTLIDAGAPVEAIRTLDGWNAYRIEVAMSQARTREAAAELFAGIPAEYLD